MTDNDNAPLFSIKNRRLYIDSDEHGFSSGKLVGHAFSDQTERQVNAFANGLGRFRHAVAPVVLSRAVHDQQASGGEVEGPGVVLAGPVAETETAGGAQVDRSDGRFRSQLRFVVAMPRNAVAAVAVEIEKHAVEAVPG